MMAVEKSFITKFQNFHLLKILEDFAGDGLGRHAEVGRLGTPPVASTFHLGEGLTPALPRQCLCRQWQRT